MNYAMLYLKYSIYFGGMVGMIYGGKVFYSIGIYSDNHTIFDTRKILSYTDYYNGVHFAIVGMVLGGMAGAIIMPLALPILYIYHVKRWLSSTN